jgi:hypothetical protein
MTKNDSKKTKKEPLTKKEFFEVLKKVTKPTEESSEKEKSKTSESDHPDDYTEKHTH